MQDRDQRLRTKVSRALLTTVLGLRPFAFYGPVNNDPKEGSDDQAAESEQGNEHKLPVAAEVAHEDAATLFLGSG